MPPHRNENQSRVAAWQWGIHVLASAFGALARSRGVHLSATSRWECWCPSSSSDVITLSIAQWENPASKTVWTQRRDIRGTSRWWRWIVVLGVRTSLGCVSAVLCSFRRVSMRKDALYTATGNRADQTFIRSTKYPTSLETSLNPSSSYPHHLKFPKCRISCRRPQRRRARLCPTRLMRKSSAMVSQPLNLSVMYTPSWSLEVVALCKISVVHHWASTANKLEAALGWPMDWLPRTPSTTELFSSTNSTIWGLWTIAVLKMVAVILPFTEATLA